MITKTIKLNIDRMQLPTAFIVAALVFIVAGGISAVGRYTAAQAVAQPTPALPAYIIQTATPLPLPAPEPIQVTALLPRFVVCYDQPVNGAVLGPIPAPDASAVVARYGASWVMVPWDGGHVWLRAADVGLPDVADLAPPEPPRIVVVSAPAPAYAAPTMPPVYETSYEPQAPAYEPASAPVATVEQVRAEDFKEPDRAATCAFVGCL